MSLESWKLFQLFTCLKLKDPQTILNVHWKWLLFDTHAYSHACLVGPLISIPRFWQPCLDMWGWWGGVWPWGDTDTSKRMKSCSDLGVIFRFVSCFVHMPRCSFHQGIWFCDIRLVENTTKNLKLIIWGSVRWSWMPYLLPHALDDPCLTAEKHVPEC